MVRVSLQKAGNFRGPSSQCQHLIRAGLLVIIVSRPCAAACSEKPTVFMDERTAESHLLAKQDLELPAHVPRLARLHTVILMATVDRNGVICEVTAVRGPVELRKRAIEGVRKHWRYRPFLVDWRPVVVRFPVTVRFVHPPASPTVVAAKADGPGRPRRAS